MDTASFVRNMPQAAFRVLEDGKPQGITHFASEDVPLELVVAIDISRQHGAGDAEAEESGEGIPRATCRIRIRSRCSDSTTASSR